MILVEDEANRVYTLLVNIGGAQEDKRNRFIRCAAEDFTEYRFQGDLGFGGKIHAQNGRLWVSCYHDEHTEERDRIIAKINNDLKELGIAMSERSTRFTSTDPPPEKDEEGFLLCPRCGEDVVYDPIDEGSLPVCNMDCGWTGKAKA